METRIAILPPALRWVKLPKSNIEGLDGVVRLFGRQASFQLIDSKRRPATTEKFREEHFFLSDPSIFKILSFVFIKGNQESALKDPSSLVINRDIAIKYFGSVETAMGSDVLFEGHRTLTVSGVIENYPYQSHLTIKMLAHFDHYYSEERPEIQQYLRTDWLYNPVLTYVLLKPGKDPLARGSRIKCVKGPACGRKSHQRCDPVITTFEGYSLALRFFICGRRRTTCEMYIFCPLSVCSFCSWRV